MFVWIEGTPIAQWVSLSLYAYPFLLSVHIYVVSVYV